MTPSCRIHYWQLMKVYIFLNIATNVAAQIPPGFSFSPKYGSNEEDMDSTIANDPPIHLSEGMVISSQTSCGRLDYTLYDSVVFEGFVNLAKLLSYERSKGTLYLTLHKGYIDGILCQLDYQEGSTPPCKVTATAIIRCSCLPVTDMILRAAFDLEYLEYYRDGGFDLYWVSPENDRNKYHSLSSEERMLPMGTFGSYSSDCSYKPRDAMPHYYEFPRHTVADDPPVYLSELHTVVAPNTADINDEDLYQKIVFDGYVNMCKVPLNERQSGSVRIVCNNKDDTIQFCKIDNANTMNPNIQVRSGANCSCGKTLQDLKLRVFAEIDYSKTYKDCQFFLHWVAAHTLSSNVRHLTPPRYAGRVIDLEPEEQAVYNICQLPICSPLMILLRINFVLANHTRDYYNYNDEFRFSLLPNVTTTAESFFHALNLYYDAMISINTTMTNYMKTGEFHVQINDLPDEHFFNKFRDLFLYSLSHLYNARALVAVYLKVPIPATRTWSLIRQVVLATLYSNLLYILQKLNKIISLWLVSCTLCREIIG